uniref:Uncharacterized protein n=1 Tax=Acrobeloides nanus TaxID=290746 RepID=A0A914E0D2_9BILA
MNFWCDASTNYTKIPIALENNHKIPLSEDWDRMKSWITFKDDCQPMTIGKFILNLIAKIFGDEFNGKCVTHDG